MPDFGATDLDAQRTNLNMATSNSAHPFTSRATRVFQLAKLGGKNTVAPSMPAAPAASHAGQDTGAAAHTQTSAALRGGPRVSHAAGNYLQGLVGHGGVSNLGTNIGSSSAPASMGPSQTSSAASSVPGTMMGTGQNAQPSVPGVNALPPSAAAPTTASAAAPAAGSSVVRANQIRCYHW